MPEPLLELRGLCKNYGALAVTDDVSLTVLPQEIHAIIGPNGAGKTTLIHQISGTLRPDRGSVLFAGRDVTALPVERRARLGLARSFQITSIVPGFSVLENVALAVQARSGSSFRFLRPAGSEAAINRDALAALEAVGLAGAAGRMANALSHGEKRQLELAIAIAMRPRLLLLDEPLAGAGPEETARLIGLLRDLRQRYGILLVEHDMQAVFSLADRISVLVYGRVAATGTAAEIRADPEVRRAYLGEDELA
ncbi:ABC transporter ATP-binding protein [Azospirillum picis]|uniref:Branched-chain amino acid transport system ATP-binding protein n=1 Tax=Azospirillum picis TaxID=488438 RepID=A0ABU0MNU4_9PROT|nr:ABC transporter ATP-binding protein [Azospirillum picis]MBP2301165.1 branched-chain amino acid transport system ATP-binding protein [Azospirillum picis]MDQ0534873.1 branched-chain amino acid transport system ATP-binding protein [Azospirillum picis]